MSPRRFELSWDRKFGYRVTVPRLLPEHGDRMAVREDIITAEDVEAVASELALIDDHNPNDLTPAGWTTVRDGYQEKARRVLALVLGSDKEGEDA